MTFFRQSLYNAHTPQYPQKTHLGGTRVGGALLGGALLAGAVLAGCMSQFTAGPQAATRPAEVKVEAASCDTRADLFDCKTLPAVVLFVADYFKLNGLAPATKPDAATLKLRATEDHNVVALRATLTSAAGEIWSTEAQGDTMLRALVRLELILEAQAGFKERYLTSDDTNARVRKSGRTRLTAAKNEFEYK